jgi:hypothetical protein
MQGVGQGCSAQQQLIRVESTLGEAGSPLAHQPRCISATQSCKGLGRPTAPRYTLLPILTLHERK